MTSVRKAMAKKRRIAEVMNRPRIEDMGPPSWTEMRLFRTPWEWLDWRRAKQRSGSALRIQPGEA